MALRPSSLPPPSSFLGDYRAARTYHDRRSETSRRQRGGMGKTGRVGEKEKVMGDRESKLNLASFEVVANTHAILS